MKLRFKINVHNFPNDRPLSNDVERYDHLCFDTQNYCLQSYDDGNHGLVSTVTRETVALTLKSEFVR